MERELQTIVNLMTDKLSNRVAVYEDKDTAVYADEAIRQAFLNILGDDKLTYAGWRNHKNEIFTVWEVVLNTNLPNAWENSAFYRQFVESHNGAIGDKNEFLVNDNSVLVASTFSGNHWDTDRKKVSGNRAFSLDAEWLYIRLYDDFERFLKGVITLVELVQKMQKAMQNAIDSKIYTSFNGAGAFLPSAFQVTGTYDRDKMLDLIQRVEVATQKGVVLAGTKTALSAITKGMSAEWIANSQKEELATTGTILKNTGLGVEGIAIPQTFYRGSYDFKVDNKSIFVLPDDEKFVKVWFEGETRAREMNMHDTHDQTIDTQIQTKVGVGVVFSNVFGKYTLA